MSKKLNIYKRIHFLGWVDNPYKYIKHSNILVCTSQTESFGNVIVEAMICGIPVISTRCGGPEEIINNDVDGFLVDIGDIEDLVEKINFNWVLTPCYNTNEEFPMERFIAVINWNEAVGGPFRVIGQQHKWIFGPTKKNV